MRCILAGMSEELLTLGTPDWPDGKCLWVTVMIDWQQIDELRGEIGAEGFAEVVDMFLEEAEGAVAALSRGIPAEEVEGMLHFLKGSALNLGLTDLAAICQEGERRAAAGDGAQVDFAMVVSVYRTSRAALLGGLSQDRAGAA